MKPRQTKMDLLKDPLPELLRKTSTPAIMGMLFGTLYNIIDTFYAGLLSTNALAALTLSFPIFFLIVLTISVGYSNGLKAVLGYELGKKNYQVVSGLISQGIPLGILLGLLANLTGYYSLDFILALFEGTENTKILAREYLDIILIGGVGMNLLYALLAPLGAIGDNKTMRNGEILAAIANLILNPILMFGWFGLPSLGIAGLALATVIIWFLFSCYVSFRLMQSEMRSYITLQALRPNFRLMGQIIQQALPNIVNMARIGIVFGVFAYVMSKYGTHVVAGYGVGFRIEGLIILPVIGLNFATMAIFAQNYGAKNYARVESLYYLSMKIGLTFMFLGGMFLYVAGSFLTIPFAEDERTRNIAFEYLRIDAIGLGAIAMINLSIALLQGMQKSILSLFILLVTQALLPGILLPYIATIGSYEDVWWTMVAILWISALCMFILTRYILKNWKKKLELTEDKV